MLVCELKRNDVITYRGVLWEVYSIRINDDMAIIVWRSTKTGFISAEMYVNLTTTLASANYTLISPSPIYDKLQEMLTNET